MLSIIRDTARMPAGLPETGMVLVVNQTMATEPLQPNHWKSSFSRSRVRISVPSIVEKAQENHD